MELMKNGFNASAIARIASALSSAYPDFKSKEFVKTVISGLEPLELKPRVEFIIKTLKNFLPECFLESVTVLLETKNHWDHGDPDDPLRSFAAWPIIDYIAAHGLEHPEQSLNALKELTPLFSAEFAIRPFIKKYPELCHQYFTVWINDENEHVRRLVSEGTRPLLPWGVRLTQFVENPEANIPLLEVLSKDTSLYVRRSVANHLNDIAKNQPELVLNVCKNWLDANNKNMNWLITHATRTIVKSGHPGVFPLLGFTESPELTIENLTTPSKEIKLGDAIAFSFSLSSRGSVVQKVVVDYALHFVKANGKTKPKVFKLKNTELKVGETLNFSKAFSFKPITTRKYYAGEHKIEILINGKAVDDLVFNVI